MSPGARSDLLEYGRTAESDPRGAANARGSWPQPEEEVGA